MPPLKLISIILCWLLTAPAWGQEAAQLVTLFSAKKGLVRNGLVGAWNLGTVNLLKHTGNFSADSWQYDQSSIVDSKLIESTALAWHRLVQAVPLASGVTVTLSIDAKASERQFLILWTYDTGDKKAWFDLSSGQILTVESGLTAHISNIGNGWYRCSVTRTSAASTLYTVIAVSEANNTFTYTGDGISGIYLRNAQLNEGPTALPYVATTDGQAASNAVSGGAAVTRGTTTVADTNDPTLRLLGYSFDGVDDRLLSLPTKGSAWTTINCSGSHCYGVDSAGGSFVDGVATAGATEFALTTAGGYSGTLSWLGRWSRVLTPREHAQNYRQHIKPLVNAAGGTLP
jgi:hypothetical protein